ncbi:hypothetical protein IW15_13445 [Chryseobacterium soli]|uniref:Uncharacterized protein n=1 Tax=Chryseobacterium soli TaxID=445961 RepID=A0A086A766_9FLAO|nr:hypothetical protein [Chryseobacterium soli]KFF12530.1 hypothetical protein IW15_13445 [Chryseobacterium soli]
MKKIALLFSLLCCTFFFAQKSQNYVQVSYGSICCGTPSPDPVISYLEKFAKKNKKKSFEVYSQSGLGREGEFKLYIGIDSLSKRERITFIKGLETVVETQNNQRNKSRDGRVSFDDQKVITKADLANSRNLTIYKK